MESVFKALRSNMFVQAILFILLGLFLILWPGVTVVTVIYLFGALFALSGVASLISYARQKSVDYHSPSVLTTGVLCLLIALVAFVFPGAVASFFSIVAGIILALCGIVCAVRSLELRQFQDNSWIAGLVIGILVAIGGIVVIVNPFGSASTFILVLGVIMLVNGACQLFMEYQLRRLQKLAIAEDAADSDAAKPRT